VVRAIIEEMRKSGVGWFGDGSEIVLCKIFRRGVEGGEAVKASPLFLNHLIVDYSVAEKFLCVKACGAFVVNDARTDLKIPNRLNTT